MTNSIYYYEKKFDDAYQAAKQKNEASVSERATPEMMAVIAVVDAYAGKKFGNHQLVASLIESGVLLMISSSDVFQNSFQGNGSTKEYFERAVNATMDTSADRQETPEQYFQRYSKEFQKQILSPSLEVQKKYVTFLLIEVLDSVLNLEALKSDLATLSFVLVKRLALEIPKEIMKRIIDGTNFSKGFFSCGSAKSMRAEELATLAQQEMPEKSRPITLEMKRH